MIVHLWHIRNYIHCAHIFIYTERKAKANGNISVQYVNHGKLMFNKLIFTN